MKSCNIPLSEYLHDPSVRICSLYYLLNETRLNEKFFKTFVENVIEKDKEFSFGNQKLYINSLVHRERFRLWQSVLAILPRLNEVSKNYLIFLITYIVLILFKLSLI